MKKHIILFGGVFDPPHLGHQQVTKQLLEKNIADEVWYVPTEVHDFEKNMTDSGHRVAMLKLILQDHSRIELCEIERGGVSHTYDTLKQLSAKHPDINFSWVIGADNLEKFHLWYQYEQMLKEFKFYVYPRKDCAMKPLYEGMIPLQDFKEVVVSSTEIREKTKKGEPVKRLVDVGVEKYMIDNQLYT